jgi:peptidoglycan/LPS O-acetylase OafA/YrhL
MVFKAYTKRDTTIIKGFAILCIVLHNFFHWLTPMPGENEFDFSPLRIQKLFDLLGQYPGECINTLLSYFGHFGVQLFLLVSGFGLAFSMLRRERSWGVFMLERLKKLYPLLIVGVLVCFLGCILMNGRMFVKEEWREIGYKLLFIQTLLPESGTSFNGPWWFFCLIFQLYLLFPLLFRCIRKWRWKAFGVLLVISYGLFFLFRYGLNLYHGTILMQNAPGHLPEFALGILLAFSKDKKIHWLWLVLALGVFVGGNFIEVLYPFTFLSLCVITVFAYQGLKQLKQRKFSTLHSSLFTYFGGISMMLFVVHGYFREPVLKLANTMTGAWGHLFAGLLYFVTVWGIALAAKPLYDFLEAQLDRIKGREHRCSKIVQTIFQVAFVLFFLYVGSYFVRQNLAKHPVAPLAASLEVEQGQVTINDKYVSLAKFPLEKNHFVLHIEGSFELEKGMTPPYLTVDIQDVLWKIMTLHPSHDGEWIRYTFKYDYHRPFVRPIRGKDLTVYFWNRDQKEMPFRNFTIFVNY